MKAETPVLAAGAVCWRPAPRGGVEVLLIHRDRHGDVSLPKGKVDPGETLPETAVREVAEETGLVVGLGPPLGISEYRLPNGRPKQVSYWAAEVGTDAIGNQTFTANEEVAELSWVPLEHARDRLSYPHDAAIVDRFAALVAEGRARTFAIVALRHGKAVPHEHWDGPDATRPLLQRGIDQALSVAPGIAAFRPRKLLSSTAARCLATIAPVARLTGLDVTDRPALSQDAYDPAAEKVRRIAHRRLRKGVTTVVCSHGPVLPQLIEAVAEETGTSWNERLRRACALSTGEFAVLHVAAEQPHSGLVAVEIHGPTV